MNELFIFANPAQARHAGFRGAQMRHPELPHGHVFYNPSELGATERLRGVRYDRVYVDSMVSRAHGWKWRDAREQILAWCTKPETVWIES